MLDLSLVGYGVLFLYPLREIGLPSVSYNDMLQILARCR